MNEVTSDGFEGDGHFQEIEKKERKKREGKAIISFNLITITLSLKDDCFDPALIRLSIILNIDDGQKPTISIKKSMLHVLFQLA